MPGPTPPLRVHRIPFSTNVERIALACGIKGIAVEWVDHDPADRSALIELSGQELTPVAEFGPEAVVFDSPRILERLEREFPEPPLFPADPAARARAEIFVEWFNEVWKLAPNALDADDIEPAEEAAHTAAIEEATARFEAVLGKDDWLGGPGPGIADVIAWPFLRYAVDQPDPGDNERFHAILHERLSAGEHPALDAWVERVRALPRA